MVLALGRAPLECAAIVVAVVGCGGSQELATMVSDANEPIDAGPPAPEAPVGSQVPDPPPAAEGCSELPSLEPGRIEMVPESATVFSHASEPCNALRSGLLLKNVGATQMNVTGISISPGVFHFGSLALPAIVASGDTLRVELGYARTDVFDDETSGNLRVRTSEGCADFEVLGLSSNGGLVTYSELAIDFGTVSPSTKPAPRTVNVLYQRSPEFAQTEFSGFSVDPPGLFEIVRAPESALRPESCESFSIDVRFVAPTEAGPVEGALLWLQETGSPEGIAEGIVRIPLYGRVE